LTEHLGNNFYFRTQRTQQSHSITGSHICSVSMTFEIIRFY